MIDHLHWPLAFLFLAVMLAVSARPIDAQEPVPSANLDAFRTAPAAIVPPAPAADRLVGVAYTTWHPTDHWTHVWGTPLLGDYPSDDRPVIKQHAKWLTDAGVDFIYIDWSNDLSYTYNPATPRWDFDMIEGATFTIFDEFEKMQAEGAKTPKISIMIGNPGEPDAVTNGDLQKKADQVWNQFVANPNYRPLVQDYLGKPLLIVYVNTPAPYQTGVPSWNDPRFTVRYMTGFITQQHALMGPPLVSKFGYWSWEDRGPETYPIYEGHPEAMTVVAAWRNDPEAPTPGRLNGETFRAEWERARKVGPAVVLVNTWNEWSLGEQPSAEVSKDIEPSKQFGMQDLEILKHEVTLYKEGK
jgi:hypothetical protein